MSLRIQIGITFFAALVPFVAFGRSREITVTPRNVHSFRCQVGPEHLPLTMEDGMLKLRVGTIGGDGPYYWRVPFRHYSNGDNDISVAQAGDTGSKDSSFIISLDATKLPTNDENKKIELQLFTKSGEEATCNTQIAVMEAANKAVDPGAVLPRQAGLTP